MKRILLFVSLLAFSTAACSSDRQPAETAPASTPPAGHETAAALPAPNAELDGLAPREQAAGSINAFALDMYRVLAKTEANFVFSPAQLATALTLVQAHASGETAEELALALRYPADRSGIHAGYASLWKSLPVNNDASQACFPAFFTAWASPDRAFTEAFETSARRAYRAVPQVAELQSPEAFAQAVNSWWGRESSGGESVTVTQRVLGHGLSLAGHATVRGHWTHAFVPRQTKARPFTLAGGEEVEVNSLWQVDEYHIALIDGGRMIEIPYVGHTLDLFVVLPSTPDGLAGFEERLTHPDTLDAWADSLRYRHGEAQLPEIRVSSNPDYPRLLQALGVRAPFATAGIDGAIEGDPLPLEGLILPASYAFKEQGSDVSDVSPDTTRLSGVRSVIYARAKADRPFLWFVRHRPSGALLLMGRVTDPRTAG